MALRKAANSARHPAERFDAPSVDGEAQVFALPERASAPEPADVQVTSRAVAQPRTPAPAPAAQRPSKPSDPPVREGEGAPRPSAPAPAVVVAPVPAQTGGGEVRRTKVSNRGKENATFRWSRAEAEQVKQALRAHAPRYRAHFREVDPDGKHLLSLSPFTATALSRALDHPGEWVASVRNDGRKEAVKVAMQQVGLVWDRALSDRLHETWERMDAEMTQGSFAVTKANVAIAGILHEIARAEEWVLDVPNDDRFSEPTAIDRRTRTRDAGEGAALS